jgi:vacuolar protein sorting-associated protein 41
MQFFFINILEYIIGLLNNIGTHVDPVELINRIPNGVKIKGLRDALVKILQDYRVQLSLLEGSKKIMSGDCLNLIEKQIRVVRQGISVESALYFTIFSGKIEKKKRRKYFNFIC